MATYYKVERGCEECGQNFWGTRRARVCSESCRGRLWRKQRSWTQSVELADLCKEVLMRRTNGSASWSKLLPRLFRATAAELRRRGWDPIELLLGMPDEPVNSDEKSIGGIEGEAPHRRMWLHPPERELELLETSIADRGGEGFSTEWHLARREQLQRVLAARSKKPTTRKGPEPKLPRGQQRKLITAAAKAKR